MYREKRQGENSTRYYAQDRVRKIEATKKADILRTVKERRMKLYEIEKEYADFQYPQSIIKAVELNLVDFEFWYFMDEEKVESRINGLKKRYPGRKLIPFARRDDCDDIACFEVGKGEAVQIIHDFASEGYEQREEYKNFWDWMKTAIDELISSEENMYDSEIKGYGNV